MTLNDTHSSTETTPSEASIPSEALIPAQKELKRNIINKNHILVGLCRKRDLPKRDFIKRSNFKKV